MRKDNAHAKQAVTFSPRLSVDDPLSAYWLNQVTVRLRREVCWRISQPAAAADSLSESLGLRRYWEEKQAFFAADPTARYLTRQIQAPPPSDLPKTPRRGSFQWVAEHLQLNDCAAFVLALGLAVVFDNAVESVISACLNDSLKTHPTLSLAQKLWDRPGEVPVLADAAHPLYAYGLLRSAGSVSQQEPVVRWDTPVVVPPLVASQLLSPSSPLPPSLSLISPARTREDSPLNFRPVEALLTPPDRDTLRVVPVLGNKGAAHQETVTAAAGLSGTTVIQCKTIPSPEEIPAWLKGIATFCWLRNLDLYLDPDVSALLTAESFRQRADSLWPSMRSVPIRLYLGVHRREQLKHIPEHLVLPAVPVSPFPYRQRRELWHKLLGDKVRGLEKTASECSRRFRYEEQTLRRVIQGIHALPGPITDRDLFDVCRAHLELDLGELAQEVTPRFKDETLILPHRQHRQFMEVGLAMKSLTEVHYEWGTADAWNESGISVLFAGPPGTGKTMAAEILARELELPIYRIDLSQVVNKYIGETEKNLKRLFDAAEISDLILFFDEADSLFGRRTEVKDAHDRYANLEISYLLERMERFKGLAILATNRKDDLDEAFLRRLRYIIDFPFPGIEEREKIWRQVIPANVDYDDVDIDFLSSQFQLSGGHIRSIVLNACLQEAAVPGRKAAADGKTGRLGMEQVIIAVRREYDKMDRAFSLEHFGPYAHVVKQLEEKDK